MPVRTAVSASPPATLGVATPTRLRRLPSLSLKVIHFDDPQVEERRRVEAFVEQTYARTYGGRIASHYPTLMSVQDEPGRIYAVVGFRLAGAGPLFLEQYLEVPIEQAAMAPRAGIAEIGNLASNGRGATVFLFLELAAHLRQIGCRIAVATATAELRGIFDKAGFPTLELARARPERLPDNGQAWGRYYEADPVVLAGSIAETLPNLRSYASERLPEQTLRSKLHYAGRRPS